MPKDMKKLLPLLFIAISSAVCSASVDTISVYSPSMNKEIACTVCLPEQYDASSEATYPVLYLLHGHGGNHEKWLQIQPELPALASRYGMIVVMPDGANAWYWDSPVDSTLRYETFVATELVDAVDSLYKTVADKDGRAITGLSMGGEGGLWLGIRHQDTFGACGSTSGGVDVRPFPGSWNVRELLGEYSECPDNWDSHTIASQLDLVGEGYPIIIDCGTEDFFFGVNKALHEEMLERGIKHEFIARPGIHRDSYWALSLEPQMLFFSRFFTGRPVYQPLPVK